jgi:HlyD family secretion protein
MEGIFTPESQNLLRGQTGSVAGLLVSMPGKIETGLPMTYFAASAPSRLLFASAVVGLLSLLASPTLAADDTEVAPKGAAVTVLKAAKSCFANIVEVSGTIIPREETQVRPERMGLKVSEVMADAGDTVTAGQVLARLTLPEGGTVTVQTPVAGLISATTAAVGAMASGKGEALFSVIARSEFDLVGLVPTRDIAKLAVNQAARIKIIGVGEVDGKVRRLSPTVQPDSQLAQAYIGITTNRRLLVNSSGRALITTGQSCGVSVPLTAILYGTAGTVVQVVKRARVETRRVETGLMSGGQVEIREGIVEGDIVVARAGALLREGDPVRPVMAAGVK